MPLCMSLQYPLQNRAKIQKKIEICKKNNKIPDFSRVHCRLAICKINYFPGKEQILSCFFCIAFTLYPYFFFPPLLALFRYPPQG